VTIEANLAFFQHAMQVTDGVPSHFVFNMDEMGHQDEANRTAKTCLVPAYHPTKHVYIPVSRTGKRITQMAAIAADGSVWKPEILIPRKTVDTDLLLTVLTSEKVTKRSQPPGFVAAALFDAWPETTFLPELTLRRTKFQYTGPAVLFLDQCSAHFGHRFRFYASLRMLACSSAQYGPTARSDCFSPSRRHTPRFRISLVEGFLCRMYVFHWSFRA
jgi:hypothetical protein